MLDWLNQIASFLMMIVNGVIMVIKSMFEFITMVPAWVTLLTGLETNLPSVIAPFIIFGILVSTLLLILGRL